MKRPRFLRQKEVDIKLRHEQAERPRKLVPWWARALRRIGMRQGLRRQQPSGSLSGARGASADRGTTCICAAQRGQGLLLAQPPDRRVGCPCALLVPAGRTAGNGEGIGLR
jgi:hypothetical protein